MHLSQKISLKQLCSLTLFFAAVHLSVYAEQLLDLEQYAQDFIVETKQIIIPDFPGAFNASIIRWNNILLLVFRVRNENMISTFQMGVVELDDDFNVIGTPHFLDMSNDTLSSFVQYQDPRLIIIKHQLYIIYSNVVQMDDMITRRMFVAQLHYKKKYSFITDPRCLHSFEGYSKRWEKNWVPFNYKDNLLLAYSLFPHRILQPSLEQGKCTTINSTRSSISWDWGELRGGTPALQDDNEYLAFFHSSKNVATVQSGGKKIQHYVMGAYTFSASPPFEITRMSPEPIVGKDFYNAPPYNTWKPLRVVFPMGCMADENYVWFTYGRQDFEIWVAKCDKKALYKTLVPCLPAVAEEIYEASTENEQQTYTTS